MGTYLSQASSPTLQACVSGIGHWQVALTNPNTKTIDRYIHVLVLVGVDADDDSGDIRVANGNHSYPPLLEWHRSTRRTDKTATRLIHAPIRSLFAGSGASTDHPLAESTDHFEGIVVRRSYLEPGPTRR
jgi:hypothetical protein